MQQTHDHHRLQDRAVMGVFWAAAQKWLVRISTLVGFVLLGRLLTPVEFGVVALAMTIITVLNVVTDAGFTSWLIQRRTLDDRALSTAFWISTGIGALLTAAIALTAGAVAGALDSEPLAVLLPVLSVTMVVAGLSSVPAGLLQRELRFRALAVRQVIATVLSVVVAVTSALLGAGVWALVAQHLVRVVVAAVVLWVATPFRPRLVLGGAEAREMTAFGGKALGVQMGSALREQGESFVIGAAIGTTALGYWTIAGRLVHVVVELCSAAIGVVAQPVFAALQDDRARLVRAFARTTASGALLLAPAMVGMSLVSAELVPFVFGEQWERAAEVAAVLALGMLATGPPTPPRALLLGVGRVGPELALTAVHIAGQVVLVLALAQQPLLVVASALAAWAVLDYPLRALVSWRLVGVGAGAYRETLALLLAAGAAAAAALAVDLWAGPQGLLRIVVVLAVFGPVYTALTAVLARRTVKDVLGAVLGGMRRRRDRAAAPDDHPEAPGDDPVAPGAPPPPAPAGHGTDAPAQLGGHGPVGTRGPHR